MMIIGGIVDNKDSLSFQWASPFFFKKSSNAFFKSPKPLGCAGHFSGRASGLSRSPGHPGKPPGFTRKLGTGAAATGFLNGNGKSPFLRWETHPRMVISWGLMGLDFFGDLLGIFHWGILHYQIKLSQDIQRMESHIVAKQWNH